jgi:acetyltransferase-like isoleucine patch superfamily enzyme
LVPGLIGKKVRGVFYYLALEQCSKEVTVDFGTFFVWRDCRLGRNVYIGARCIISCADIHDDALVGSHVNILSGKEQHSITDLNTPIRLQGGKRVKITIGRDTWLGNGAVIMADIGDQSIVAAGSVVVKNVDPLLIVGGNPAKILKKRDI